MTNLKFVVEDTYSELVVQILQNEGFSDIKRMPRNALFDYMAIKDAKTVFIEAKTRSFDARSQNFILREKQLKRLEELENNTGSRVYLLLLNKMGYKLVLLRDFLIGSTDLKPFQVSVHKAVDTGSFTSWYFDASKAKWTDLNKRVKKARRSKTVRFWPVKDEDKLTKRFYKVIPYDIVCNELRKGREVMVEGITRQTAWYTRKKLSELLGKEVAYGVAEVQFDEGEKLKGYWFALS
jgi:Holliday junction resolvase